MLRTIANTDLVVSGRLLRVARLRHEYFEYLDDPLAFVAALQQTEPFADVVTFLQEAHYPRPAYSFHQEEARISVLSFKNYKDWWTNLHFKVRNKARQSEKKGVELRPAQLNAEFVRGVKGIYDESPIRQDRRFPHYGKTLERLTEDLSSFPECTSLTGAYYQDELVGFMKLFEGKEIMRTVHIIAKLAHRDKCVMDALVAKAVELSDQKGIRHLHYGDWAYRGLGVFRAKFGFEPHPCPRYYVARTARGKAMLRFGFHHRVKERLPQRLIDELVGLRSRWYALSQKQKDL
jgi:hypothetical protein